MGFDPRDISSSSDMEGLKHVATVNELKEIIFKYFSLENLYSSEGFPYSRGKIRFDFAYKSDVPMIEENRNQEEKIKNTISHNYTSQNRPSSKLVMYRGGTGAGKSTTIRYVCNFYSLNYLYVDFNNVSDELFGDEEAQEEDVFWAHVRSVFDRVTNQHNVSPDEEVTKFWLWCLDKTALTSNCPTFSNLIANHSYTIREIGDYKGEDRIGFLSFLKEERLNLLKEMSNIESSWYRIFLFSYIQSQRENSQEIIIIDNVDHLTPSIQNKIFEISGLLARNLNMVFVVVLRPHTYENLAGSKVFILEEHLSPDVVQCIADRLHAASNDPAIDKNKRQTIRRIESLLRTQRHRQIDNLIRSTSGINIRLAYKNFCNFFCSPEIGNINADLIFDPHSHILNTSDITRAFFYSEDMSIDERNLENIFTVNSNYTSRLSLLKPRILHSLATMFSSGISSEQLISNMNLYGFEDAEVLAALRELMKRRRSLIWSDKALSVNQNNLGNSLFLSPLGYSYWKNLFGEYYYFEVCLTKSRIDKIPPEIVIERFRSMFKQDLIQIDKFIHNGPGYERYLQFYPEDTPSLSSLFWKTFRFGVEKRAQRLLLENPLTNYEAWMEQKLSEVLPYENI